MLIHTEHRVYWYTHRLDKLRVHVFVPLIIEKGTAGSALRSSVSRLRSKGRQVYEDLPSDWCETNESSSVSVQPPGTLHVAQSSCATSEGPENGEDVQLHCSEHYNAMVRRSCVYRMNLCVSLSLPCPSCGYVRLRSAVLPLT